MFPWLDHLQESKAGMDPAFLVTVMDVRGSAPRECGAKMLVTAADIIGTIGGGQLEYQCTRSACEQLNQLLAGSSADEGTAETFVRRFPLGANCGQCCGGVVEVLFERLSAGNSAWIADLRAYYRERVSVVIATAVEADGRALKYLITPEECREYGVTSSQLLRDAITTSAREIIAQAGGARRLRLKSDGETVPVLLEPVMTSSFNLALFGAGHVGSAVVAAMAGLDCNIRWVDSRRDIFPPRLPAYVTPVESGSPAQEVAAMPAGTFYLVMTHSHALDLDICCQILRRDDFVYCGLIGSVSKRRRFERLMRKQGMPDAMLDRLTCPIGVSGIENKKPEAIAIAVAAELLQKRAASTASHAEHRGNVRVLRRSV